MPHKTCRFLVLEGLFSHLSKAVKTTDKNSKMNRHSFFYLLILIWLGFTSPWQTSQRPESQYRLEDPPKPHGASSVDTCWIPLGSLDRTTRKRGRDTFWKMLTQLCMLKKRHEIAQGSPAVLLRTAEGGVKWSSSEMMISSYNQTPQQRWGKTLSLRSPFKVWPHFQAIFISSVHLTLPA